jgi:hypothetical protein
MHTGSRVLWQRLEERLEARNEVCPKELPSAATVSARRCPREKAAAAQAVVHGVSGEAASYSCEATCARHLSARSARRIKLQSSVDPGSHGSRP